METIKCVGARSLLCWILLLPAAVRYSLLFCQLAEWVLVLTASLVIGDGAVGKTTLLIARTYKCFSQDYVPTVLDNFATIVDVGSRPVGIGTFVFRAEIEDRARIYMH